MTKFKNLSLILFLALFESCSIFFPDIFMLSIKNNTNQNIKIIAFSKHKKKEEVTILKHETYSEIIDDGRSFANNPTIFVENDIDSIMVVNDSNKGFVQYCEGVPLVLANNKCIILKNLAMIHLIGENEERNKFFHGHKIRNEYTVEIIESDFVLDF